MKRPATEEIKRRMKPVVRFNPGRNKVVDAVELVDGTLIVEYVYTNKFKLPHIDRGHRQQRRLAVFGDYDRPIPLTDIILETTYVDKLPPRRKHE